LQVAHSYGKATVNLDVPAMWHASVRAFMLNVVETLEALSAPAREKLLVLSEDIGKCPTLEGVLREWEEEGTRRVRALFVLPLN
jgi:hypothetical protein